MTFFQGQVFTYEKPFKDCHLFVCLFASHFNDSRVIIETVILSSKTLRKNGSTSSRSNWKRDPGHVRSLEMPICGQGLPADGSHSGLKETFAPDVDRKGYGSGKDHPVHSAGPPEPLHLDAEHG